MDDLINVIRLHGHTKDEWRAIVRKVAPSITEDRFDRMWEDFLRYKRSKAMS